MSIPQEYYPSQDDLIYEEELLRNPFSLKLWWRYLIARTDSPFEKRRLIYERALKALPGSYKLWYAYLRERLELVRNYSIYHPEYKTLNNTFERALVTMHKMPRIWIMYLSILTEQKLVTRTRRSFDRALCALPVTQHDRIWEIYLVFVSQRGVPIETSLRVYRRYLKYDPGHIEEFIEFLVNSELWQEAAERLAGVLNDDQFYSIKGKTKHRLWLELCDLLTQHANEISGLNVDAIIRGGIRKFTDEIGRLWTSLADYYIRRKLLNKARDIFEEGMTTVMTVRDFSVIFDAYSQFEESMLALKMEDMSDEEDGEGTVVDDEDDDEGDRLNVAELKSKIKRLWLSDDKDVDLGLARLEYLMDRRPELANSVLLRQNPHNVEQWHRRVKIFEGNPARQLETYTQAVRTIDPMKAVGKPHTLWVAFAKLFETHNGINDARVIFDEAVQVNYKAVDNLASVWCEWAEMELRHKNFKVALEVMRRATAEPSVEVKRRVAADGNEPVQIKLHKSLRLWTFYVDLEESLGTLESTRAVYERILDLRIATPQIIINYAMLLEDHKYFEDAFKVYERGVKIFKYPHVKDIWVTYLTKFVKRYGKSKLERARELFEHAVEMAPAEAVKPLYLQYAKLEEDHGLAKRAMRVYDQATKAVPPSEKLSMYQIYIARAAEIFGVPKTREIYEQAIESGLPDKDAKTMCLKYAELEKNLGEIDRSRGIYKHASEFADPRSDADFWSKWHDFEVQHGNEDTFREMLRIKRSVTAKYSQVVTYSAKALTKPSLMHTQPAKLLPLWRQQFLSPPSYKYPQTICGYSFQEILREHVVYWDLSLLCLYQHNQGRFHLVGLTVHGLWESRLRYTLTYDNSGPKYIVEIIHLRDRPDQGEWERRLNNLARELSQIPQHVRAEMDKVWISNIHNANDWTVWIKERMLHGYALPNYWETVLNLSRRFVSKDSSGNIMKVMLQYNFVAGIFKVEDLKACLQKNYGFKMGVKLKEPRNQNQHYVSTVMLDEFRVLHDQALQIVDYPAQEKNKYFVLE